MTAYNFERLLKRYLVGGFITMIAAMLFSLFYTPSPTDSVWSNTVRIEGDKMENSIGKPIDLRGFRAIVYYFQKGSLKYHFKGYEDQRHTIYLPGVIKTAEGELVSVASSSDPIRVATIVLVFMLLLAGLHLYRRNLTEVWFERLKSYFMMFFICGTQYILLLIYRLQEPYVHVADGDPSGYFRVIDNILKGDFTSQCMFTAGLPIVYLPFILLTGATEVVTITPYISVISAVLAFPLSLCLLYVTAKRYLKSTLIPFIAIVGWLVISKVFFMIERPVFGGIFSPFGFLHYMGNIEYIYNPQKSVSND